MSEVTDRQNWQSALTEHFERESVAHPLPAREQLSKAEQFQCRTLGGTLISWLKCHGPRLLQERDALRYAFGVESDPAIVLTSTIPGLIAAKQILDPRPASIFFFSPEAFASFLAHHPDNTFRWHVVYSSFFSDQLETDLLARACSKYKLRPSETFWIHRESTMVARLFGRGGDHLWKWNGRKMTLLEEGFNTWLS